MAIARVQSKTANSGASLATTVSVTLDATPTAGNILVVSYAALFGLSAGSPFVTCSGVTFSTYVWIGSGTLVGVLAVGRVLSGASATITANAGSGGNAIVAAEYSGSNIVADVYAAATNTSTSAASGDTAATNAAAELWVGALAARNAITYSSPTNSFSIVGQDKSSVGTANDRAAALLERIVSSTGTANAGATLSASNVWTAQVLTLKEISGGFNSGGSFGSFP